MDCKSLTAWRVRIDLDQHAESCFFCTQHIPTFLEK